MTGNLKFRHKILIAAALVVALAFASFILFNDYRQRATLRNNAETTMESMGKLTTSNIESWLEGRIQLLNSMSEAIAREGSSEEQLRRVMSAPSYSKNYLLASSSFGGEDGAYVSYPPNNIGTGYDPRQRTWYKDAVAAQQTLVTEPYISASNKSLVITVASPVQHDNKLVGVGAITINLARVTEIINSLNFGGQGHAFIVSAQGKILIHPDANLALKPLKDAYPDGTPSIAPGLKEVTVDGKSQFIYFTHVNGIPSADWYVALVLDKDKAFAMLSELRSSAIIATVISVVIIIVLLSMLISVLMRPLTQMGQAMRTIAEGEGDLTQRLTIHGHDEFGELGASFNQFVQRIHNSIKEVSSATGELNALAVRVVSASNASMHNSDRQATRTNSVATAINELGAAAQEIAQNAALASQHSSEARDQATDGQDVVEQTLRAMNQLSTKISASCTNIETLNDKTVNIGKILEVITSISQQTNLLALNAAIEAARAGEAGRGFAVVADEVRNLAYRTQESARQVQGMIEELQVGAREAVNTMTESQRESEGSVVIANLAGERLQSVTQRIGEIDGMNQSVATATEEQTAVVESINVDINEINTLNHEGVENLQETLRACSDLEQQAARLKQLVGSFRI